MLAGNEVTYLRCSRKEILAKDFIFSKLTFKYKGYRQTEQYTRAQGHSSQDSFLEKLLLTTKITTET